MGEWVASVSDTFLTQPDYRNRAHAYGIPTSCHVQPCWSLRGGSWNDVSEVIGVVPVIEVCPAGGHHPAPAGRIKFGPTPFSVGSRVSRCISNFSQAIRETPAWPPIIGSATRRNPWRQGRMEIGQRGSEGGRLAPRGGARPCSSRDTMTRGTFMRQWCHARRLEVSRFVRRVAVRTSSSSLRGRTNY